MSVPSNRFDRNELFDDFKVVISAIQVPESRTGLENTWLPKKTDGEITPTVTALTLLVESKFLTAACSDSTLKRHGVAKFVRTFRVRFGFLNNRAESKLTSWYLADINHRFLMAIHTRKQTKLECLQKPEENNLVLEVRRKGKLLMFISTHHSQPAFMSGRSTQHTMIWYACILKFSSCRFEISFSCLFQANEYSKTKKQKQISAAPFKPATPR